MLAVRVAQYLILVSFGKLHLARFPQTLEWYFLRGEKSGPLLIVSHQQHLLPLHKRINIRSHGAGDRGQESWGRR